MSGQSIPLRELFTKSNEELERLGYFRSGEGTRQIIKVVHAKSQKLRDSGLINYRTLLNELLANKENMAREDGVAQEYLHIILREYVLRGNTLGIVDRTDLRDMIYILDRHDYIAIQDTLLNLLATLEGNTFISNYIAQHSIHEAVIVIASGLTKTRIKIMTYLMN